MSDWYNLDMSLASKDLPKEVRNLRRAAYREVLALGSVLGITAYLVHKPLTNAGEGLGLGYFVDDYDKLEKNLDKYLDKRYFHLASPETEAEYPYAQLRVCVNGSSMEFSETAVYAMHQGVYINLYLLAVPALLPSLQERNYTAVQERILTLLQDGLDEGIDEVLLRKLINKRTEIMKSGQASRSHVKYYQIFPSKTSDYKLARIQASELIALEQEPDEEASYDWSAFDFDVPEDLLRHFDLPEEDFILPEEDSVLPEEDKDKRDTNA